MRRKLANVPKFHRISGSLWGEGRAIVDIIVHPPYSLGGYVKGFRSILFTLIPWVPPIELPKKQSSFDPGMGRLFLTSIKTQDVDAKLPDITTAYLEIAMPSTVYPI